MLDRERWEELGVFGKTTAGSFASVASPREVHCLEVSFEMCLLEMLLKIIPRRQNTKLSNIFQVLDEFL